MCHIDETMKPRSLARQRPSPILKFSNFLESMKASHNLNTNPENVREEQLYLYDTLAHLTAHTRVLFERINGAAEKAKETVAYRILTETTQPTHLIVLLSVLFLTCVGCTTAVTTSVRMWTTLYITSFAIHFGTQVWMNLISGLLLYFSLPRQVFGDIQVVTFPAYYTFQSIMSIVCLTSYLQLHPVTSLTSDETILVVLLTAKFFTELMIRLFISPRLIKLKHLKSEFELATGSGKEIGKLVIGELQHCPRYMKILKSFRRVHSGIAISSMVLIGITAYHVNSIIGSICPV